MSVNNLLCKWKNDNPYGSNQAQGSIEFNLRFAGQYYDYESGLHYNIHRTYNPEVGRYMQSDPIGLAGGSNTYNYVNRNPLDGVDPLGLDRLFLNFSNNAAQGFFSALINNPTSFPDNSVVTVGHGLMSGGMVVDMHSSAMLLLKNIDSNYYNQISKIANNCNSTYECNEDSKVVSGLTFSIIVSKIIKGKNQNKYNQIIMTECHGIAAPYIDQAAKIIGKPVKVSTGTTIIKGVDGKSSILGTIDEITPEEGKVFDNLFNSHKIDEAVKYLESLNKIKPGLSGFKKYE